MKNDKKITARKNTKAANQKRQINHTSNSALAQRLRIIEWFKTNQSLTTFQARETLGVMHPGGRVMELRKRGYDIMTYWSKEENAQGRVHRIAKYVLISRPGGKDE